MTATSEKLNPYAHYLGARGEGDVLDILAHTADHLAGLAARLDAPRLGQSPAPGKWSIRDIVCHLADTEIVFAFRLRQTVAESHHVIQPYDQEAWAAPYGTMSAPDALRAFAAVRHWNLLFLRAVLPAAAEKQVTHPERGTMTLQTIVDTMAGHDLNHTQQIEAIVGTLSRT